MEIQIFVFPRQAEAKYIHGVYTTNINIMQWVHLRMRTPSIDCELHLCQKIILGVRILLVTFFYILIGFSMFTHDNTCLQSRNYLKETTICCAAAT